MMKIHFSPKISVSLALLLIVAITFVSYQPALFNGFSSLDDGSYVTQNPLTKDLSVSSVRKIFTGFVVGNYQPLTSLVFALEYHFFHLNPFPFHLINLILHLLNTVLVFFFVYFLSGRMGTALFAGAFWALQPLHVESVAWITELKDVLFFFFYLLGLILYQKFLKVRSGARGYYSAVFLLFVLALLSKPTAVSFPLVLFLIDYFYGRKCAKAIFIEKIPFLVLSSFFGMLALYAARTPFMPYETVPPERLAYSFLDRIILSGYVFWDYLLKAFFPLQLSIFYPYPAPGGMGRVPPVFYFYFIGWLGLVWLIVKYFRQEKVFVFGFGFFLSTIFFNLPFFKAGYSLSADRFTYLPYVGIFFVAGYYFEKAQEHRDGKRGLLEYWPQAVLLGAVLVFSLLTFQRCKVWKDAGTLWQDVVDKFPKHPLGYDNLAAYTFEQGDNHTTLILCNAALALNPKYYTSHYRKGNVFLRTRKLEQALDAYNRAIEIFPNYYQALVNRGSVFYLSGELSLAVQDYSKAIGIYPEEASLFANRGTVYSDQGRLDEALADFEAVLKLDPDNPYARRKIIETTTRIKSAAGPGT